MLSRGLDCILTLSQGLATPFYDVWRCHGPSAKMGSEERFEGSGCNWTSNTAKDLHEDSSVLGALPRPPNLRATRLFIRHCGQFPPLSLLPLVTSRLILLGYLLVQRFCSSWASPRMVRSWGGSMEDVDDRQLTSMYSAVRTAFIHSLFPEAATSVLYPSLVFFSLVSSTRFFPPFIQHSFLDFVPPPGSRFKLEGSSSCIIFDIPYGVTTDLAFYLKSSTLSISTYLSLPGCNSSPALYFDPPNRGSSKVRSPPSGLGNDSISVLAFP
ncbi:hypothetical protein NMY22_g9573 [Coprinellus aureogranulatus]|nr:hypothetical protein NMY22_g9573 [Coprinellus aureogranulatus]